MGPQQTNLNGTLKNWVYKIEPLDFYPYSFVLLDMMKKIFYSVCYCFSFSLMDCNAGVYLAIILGILLPVLIILYLQCSTNLFCSNCSILVFRKKLAISGVVCTFLVRFPHGGYDCTKVVS